MSENPRRRISTDGDSKIHTITALGKLQHITSYISKSIVQINGYVDNNSKATVHKQKVVNKL